MAKHCFPTNDIDRIMTLTTLTRNSQAPESGENNETNEATSAKGYFLYDLVPAEHLERLNELAPAYKTAFGALKTQGQLKRAAKAKLQGSLNELSSMVRDIWAGIRRRSRRMNHPETVLAFYLMPKDREIPKSGHLRRWLEIGHLVLNGDSKAVEAGYPRLSNPGVHELSRLLEAAEADASAADKAHTEYIATRKELAALRDDARKLYSDMTLAARYALRDEPVSEQREIMRAVGFHFLSEASEASEEPASETGGSEPTTTEPAELSPKVPAPIRLTL